MGLLNLFAPRPQPQTPMILSILPGAAAQEIRQGRLPVLRTNKVFLKAGENCHYIDKAIYEKRIVRKRYVRKNSGYSTKGFFKGTRFYTGNGVTEQQDNVTYEQYRGVLYITNQRIIFQGEQEGFTLKLDDLVAIEPYLNCIELQTSKAQYRLFIPDGNIVQTVLQLAK